MDVIEKVSQLIAEREQAEKAAQLAAEREAQQKAEAKKHAHAMWEQLKQAFTGLCGRFPDTLTFTSIGESEFRVTHTQDKRKVDFEFRDGRLYPDALSTKGIPGDCDYRGIGPLVPSMRPNGEIGFCYAGGPSWTPVALADAVAVMLASGLHHIEETP